MISFVRPSLRALHVDLHLYDARLLSDVRHALGVQDFRWICSDEFDDFEFTPADEASMTKLLGV